MSVLHEHIKIGVEENGAVKYVTNLSLNEGTYTLTDQGDLFTGTEGVETYRTLKEREPETDFIVIPA